MAITSQDIDAIKNSRCGSERGTGQIHINSQLKNLLQVFQLGFSEIQAEVLMTLTIVIQKRK
jgi:hypothetical protein